MVLCNEATKHDEKIVLLMEVKVHMSVDTDYLKCCSTGDLGDSVS